MPNFNIVKEVNPKKSFRVASIIGKFDLKSEKITENFIGNLPIENEKWNIGIIVGNSGTGKSTIAKELFPNNYVKEYIYKNETILDDMPENKSIQEITQIFNQVGFSSPPSWLKPFSVLSEGEKMRVNLARSILEEKELIVFDEFTSVLDRNIAKIGSFAIQKAIRKLNKKFIAVSCHYDILEWLQADWVFDTNKMLFEKKKSTDQKLKLKLENVQEIYGNYLGNIII